MKTHFQQILTVLVKKCNSCGLSSDFNWCKFLRRHVVIYHSSISYWVLRMSLLRITFQIHSLFTLFSCHLLLCRSAKYLLTRYRMILVNIFVTTRNTQALLHLSDSNRIPFSKVLTISVFSTHWKRFQMPKIYKWVKPAILQRLQRLQEKVLRNLMTLLKNSFAFVLEVQFVSRWLARRDETSHML